MQTLSTSSDLGISPMSRNLNLVFEPTAYTVAQALIDTEAYKVDFNRDKKDWFMWKSGIQAPCYCDCRKLLSFPTQRHMIALAFATMINIQFPKATTIIGVATAGVPWASIVADMLGLQLAYVRANPKGHGLGKMVEGVVDKDSQVVVIDDLIASGESLMKAIKIIETETNSKVLGIQSIVNWNFTQMRNILKDYTYIALTSYPQILQAALLAGKINSDQLNQLLAFYLDPKTYEW